MDNYFLKLNAEFNLPAEVINLLTVKHAKWENKERFDLYNVPNYLFKNTKVYDVIRKFDARPAIIKMNPMSVYTWHVDTFRRCAINLLLSNFDTHCLFTEDPALTNFFVNELVYEPRTFYLFNTKRYHSVINLTQRERYTLSIGINNTPYEEVLEYCKANGI